MSQLTDPYKHLETTVRFQSNIAPEDHAYLKGLLASGAGTIQAIINTLTHCLVRTAQQHGITDFTHRDRFVALITEHFPLTGIAPKRLATDGASQQAPQRDVRRRTPNPRAKAEGKTAQHANAQSSTHGLAN